MPSDDDTNTFGQLIRDEIERQKDVKYLSKKREPTAYEDMKKELEARLIKSCEIKEVIHTMSQTNTEPLTKELLMKAINETKNKQGE